MEKEYLTVAAQMYGVESPNELPKRLYRELEIADFLCRRVNGTLRSRQVIAAIISKYKAIKN